MKPFVILALWAFVGWDVGAWAEALTGIPAVAGILVGAAIGTAFAIEARRQIAASADRGRHAPLAVSPIEAQAPLDRAA